MEDIQSGVLGLAVLSAMLAFSSSSRCKSSTVCKVSLKFIKNKWISNKLHNLVYNWYFFLNLHIWIFLPIEILVHVHNLNENVIFTIHVKLVSFLHIQKKWFVNIITCKYTKKEKESNKSGSLEMCITWYNIFFKLWEILHSSIMHRWPSCCDQMWIQNRKKKRLTIRFWFSLWI